MSDSRDDLEDTREQQIEDYEAAYSRCCEMANAELVEYADKITGIHDSVNTYSSIISLYKRTGGITSEQRGILLKEAAVDFMIKYY